MQSCLSDLNTPVDQLQVKMPEFVLLGFDIKGALDNILKFYF